MTLKNVLRKCLPVEKQAPAGIVRSLLAGIGYFRFRTWLAAGGRSFDGINLYQPLYSPWLGEPEFEPLYHAAKSNTLVSRDRCYILWRTLLQAKRLPGDFIECGVFRGGTALLEATVIRDRPLHLFDSFTGMPPDTEKTESFRPGDFNRTSEQHVAALLSAFPTVKIHAGFIPDTFKGLDVPTVAWAHVDVDLYRSVRDCIEWIYPRLAPGGVIVFDDYGFPSCPGARRAVDEAFADKPEIPICLPTGQCLVVKLPS
jgi:O-methyltransferase